MAGKNNSNEMPKVDFDKDRGHLGRAEMGYIRQIEGQTRERAEKLKRMRKGNLITGFALGAAVLGIYIYSMVAVKQETFLDDFEPPALEQKQK